MGKFIYQAIMTREDDGGYSVEFPDLPGCFTEGDGYMEAVEMAADAARTYMASLMLHGEAAEGCESVHVFFETDESYIVRGEVMSAAQAARELGVSAGRVTHMIDAGLLDGYRSGRRTFVTRESVDKRKDDPRGAGRPRKEALQG